MLGAGCPGAVSPARHHRSAYGATALLHFFFHRVTRSGPRLLLYLALVLVTSLVTIKALRSGISDSITATSAHLWKLRPDLGSFGSFGSSFGSSSGSGSGRGSAGTALLPGANNKHAALAGGGLRIVVFGENDIATSMLQNSSTDTDTDTDLGPSKGTTWTRELCIELGCTTYLSYVPDLGQPRRSLTSNRLFGAVTDDIVREAKDATPANDYAHVKEAYPVPWDAADLDAQVSQFLSQPAPRRPPKESVYVFSFGMWDVWSLAAFPYSHAEGIISVLVADIFANIETLYDAAHETTSIAFSNYTSSPVDEPDEPAASRPPTSTHQRAARGQSDLTWDDARAEPFRAVVPLLFDPSLVPGWHLSRPAPPAPALHTKPEQLRNAVRLTKRWNDFVMNEMDNWTKKGVEFVHPDDRPRLEAEAKKAAEAKKSDKVAPPNISARDEVSEDAEDAKATPSENPENTETNVTRSGQPVLARDGIVFRLSDYVMDAIINGQMKKAGVTDSKSFGKFSPVDSYTEVDTPCLMSASVGTPAEETEEIEKTEKTEEEPGKPATGRGLELCERPDRHLFFTPFSLGQHAIEEVGRMSAALLRANRSTRIEWEQTRRDTKDMERSPGSWKVYYMPS